ncbi:MAG: radical SAM protein [Armatimonadetes bacterium]|nr:radical SAM protein [Armatimonadota bacterium]
MLTGIHILLSYKCTYECDHCFVYSSPRAKGTITAGRIRGALDEARKIGTITKVYFEGGEPTLYYPLLLDGIRLARSAGFEVGIVTNAYFATSEEDAALWLAPLKEMGLTNLSISDDAFHSSEKPTPAQYAQAAALKMELPFGIIRTDPPVVAPEQDASIGGVMFRGRAVEKLAPGLPKRDWESFTECPYEDLREPSRLHLDPYGNVHLCQGLSLGNAWEKPLSMLVKHYNAASHPIAGQLASGGPARLVREYNVPHESGYVDACHLCFRARQALLDRFPEYLAPRQVYGVE